jgi:tetratricopeptide (TPR) repeat protein
MIKKIIMILNVLLIVSCGSSKKKKEDASSVPSNEKKLTVLSKEYPGVFSIADTYIHLPMEEKERDTIIFPCSNGQFPETIKKLFAEMKDANKVVINSYYVATCYYMNKDYLRALHYYGKVYATGLDISLKSKALSNMATIQWELGKYRKSIAYWREAYALKNNPTILYLLTTAELDLGLYQKLIERRAELGKYNYSDPYWKLLLAEVAFFTSDYDKAVATYETISDDLWKKKNNALVNYIVALHRTGRHDAAKNFITKWKTSLQNLASYQTAKDLFPEIKKYE